MSENGADAAPTSTEGNSPSLLEEANEGQDDALNGGNAAAEPPGGARDQINVIDDSGSHAEMDNAAISSATGSALDGTQKARTDTPRAGEDGTIAAKALDFAAGEDSDGDSDNNKTLSDLAKSIRLRSNKDDCERLHHINHLHGGAPTTPAQTNAGNSPPSEVTQSNSNQQPPSVATNQLKDPPEKIIKHNIDDFSECVLFDMHPSQFAIYNGTVANVKMPYHFTQISAKVNHGVRKELTMADIINNWLGNPAKIPNRPDPRMDNDAVNMRLTTLVERLDEDDLDKGCAVQVMATITNDTSRAWEDWKAEYFLPKTKDGKNRLSDFLDNHKKLATVNAFKVENHPAILEAYPGSKRLYDKLIENETKGGKKKKKGNKKKDVDSITAYHALLWAISVAKQQKHLEQCIMNAVEGNNRMGALNHLLLLSEYNTRDGGLKCNSLEKKWLVDNLGAPAENDAISIREAYSNVTIRDLLQKQIEDQDSMFNKDMVRMKVWVGETREKFETHRVPMSTVTNVDVEKSRNIATDKQRSSEPGENVTAATNIKRLILMMLDNKDIHGDNETVSFSPNASSGGRLYVDYRRNAEEDDEKQPIAPPPCRLFTSPEWTELSRNPNDPENLKAYMKSIDIGSVVLTDPLPANPPTIDTPSPASGSGKKRRRSPKRSNSKMVLGPSGRVYNPPFIPDFDNMIRCEGARKVGTDARKNKLKAASIAERWIDEGKRVVPLGMEEFTRAVLLCLTMPAMYRAFFKIKRADWENHPKREECEHALEYLVRTQNFTMGADDFAKPLPRNIWENEPWAERFGLDEKQTALMPEYRYLAAACCLSDLVISCLSAGGDKGLKRGLEFVRMLSTAHDDMSGYNDRAMVEILGVLYIKMQDFVKILHTRLRHESALLHKGNGDRSASGFVFWCILMGQMESVHRVMRIYGLDPKPQISTRELSFASQFKTLYDHMKRRENGRKQPTQEEKKLYRIIQDNVVIELPPVPTKDGIDQKSRMVVNARFAKTRDADANLVINNHVGMAGLTSLPLAYLCYCAKICQSELAVDNDNPRIIMSPYQGNKGGSTRPRLKEIKLEKAQWSLQDFFQPRGNDGHLNNFFEMYLFLMGNNVRKSMTSGRQQTIKKAQVCRTTTISADTWTLDVLERDDIDDIDDEEEDAKPKAVPPRQQRLNRGVTVLRALKMSILDSKNKQTPEEQIAALEEIQLLWDVHFDELSGELRENVSTVRKLTQKEKREMDDAAQDRHYASIDAKASKLLASIRDGTVEDSPEENLDASAMRDTLDENMIMDATMETRNNQSADASRDISIEDVKEFCTTRLDKNLIYEPLVGDLQAKNARAATALESWFEIGDSSVNADYSRFSPQDMATMTRIREAWMLEKDPEDENSYKLKKKGGGNSTEGSDDKSSSDDDEKDEAAASDEDDADKDEDQGGEGSDSENEREKKKAKTGAEEKLSAPGTPSKTTGKKPPKSPIATKGWSLQRKEGAIQAVQKQSAENHNKGYYYLDEFGIKVNLLSKEEINNAFHAWRQKMKEDADDDDSKSLDEKLYYVLCYSLDKETWKTWWKDHYEGEPKKLSKTDGIKDLVRYIMTFHTRG